MVVGLDRFQEHFADFTDGYVLIGGAACFLNMSENDLPFRATKDLDLVLCLEALDDEFIKAFWQFVNDGAYEDKSQGETERKLYRFVKPATEGFPFMLELLSRVPDQLTIPEGIHLTPIPAGEEISSLSAILMDDEYYQFLQAGKKIIDGVQVAGPEHLLPLKVRAWLDLSERRANGDSNVKSSDVKKHKLDVFRLMAIVDPDFSGECPQRVKDDIEEFINRMADETIDMKAVGLTGQNQADVLSEIGRIYLGRGK